MARAALCSRASVSPNQRSNEYGSAIIEAVTLRRPTVIYGNVRNTGLIDNLPDGCVEVAWLVDQYGIQPIYFGPLLEPLAAMNRSHMAVHALLGRGAHDAHH